MLRVHVVGRRVAVGSLLFVLFLCAGGAGASAADTAPKKQYALLIGCTKYQNVPALHELWGPTNDVARLAALLHDRFGFPTENITQLVGWPDKAAERASRDNIAAGFKDLIAKADGDTQIVILFSGHGTRAPIVKPTKEQRCKANELVFLPLDVQPWSDDQIPGAVTEDDLTGWLNQLRDKKASVLVVFDCCHAGSMARGPGEERVRAVKPQDLGIPDKAIVTASERAKTEFKLDPPKTGERSRGGPVLLPAGLDLGTSAKDKGSLTAIYACQPFEEAPEMRIPLEADDTPDHYFGLLTWTVTEVLSQRQGEKKLTYRELQQLLVGRYVAERGSRGPFPFIDGDLDHEVLGLQSWPGRSALVLDRKDGKLHVNAGALMGLTPESILSVHPPVGDPKPDTVLGYVQVTKAVEAARADVQPCAYPSDQTAVAADKLPAGAVCRLVERSFGDLRIKVAVAKPKAVAKDDKNAPEEEARNKRLANVSAALDGLPQEVKDLIKVMDVEANAEWVLDVEGKQVLLKQGLGAALSGESGRKEMQLAAKERETLGQTEPRREFGGYDADDVKALSGALKSDLPKVFAWQNLWHVAGNQSANGGDAGLEFKVVQLNDKGKPADPLPSGAVVHPGQASALELINNTTDNQWVILVFLDGEFGIDVVHRSLKQGQRLSNEGAFENKFGRGGMVVFAFPQKEYPQEPDFDFLSQSPLHTVSRSLDERSRAADRAPSTPFAALMKSAVIGKGGMRGGWTFAAPTNPTVLSWSWTIMPTPVKP